MSDLTRLVEQARALPSVWQAGREDDPRLAEAVSVAAALADAVERLQAQRDAAIEEHDSLVDEHRPLMTAVSNLEARVAKLEAERDRLREVVDAHNRERNEIADVLEGLEVERDQLRELLVSAEGYAISQGAERPFVAMFAEDSPLCAVIERAGCYPRDARREHPGRFALNPPPERDPMGGYRTLDGGPA